LSDILGPTDYAKLKKKIAEALREELTSGDVILSVILKDSNSDELSANIRNLDVLLSSRASEATLAEIGALVLFASTTTPLDANDTWVSPTESDPRTGRIVGSVFADQAGQICIDQSPNGTNWDISDCFNVIANQGLGFTVEKVTQYARVRYINGTTGQNVFRLYVYRRLRVI
jgi:hypothetical protein